MRGPAVLRSVGAGLLAVGLLAPLVPLVLWAAAGSWRYPALLPELSGRGLGLVLDRQVLGALGTSTLIATTVAAVALVVGGAAGRALATPFRGRRLVQLTLLAPALVPTVAVTLGIGVYFVRYGLADTVAGVVLVQLVPTVPYVALVTAAAFERLDPALDQQARMLGAGPVRRMLTVTLPAVRPALLVAAFLAFLISWSEYVLTLLVGGGTVRTLPLLLFAAIGSSDLPAAAALSLVITVPPLLLVGLTARQLTGIGLVGVGRS